MKTSATGRPSRAPNAFTPSPRCLSVSLYASMLSLAATAGLVNPTSARINPAASAWANRIDRINFSLFRGSGPLRGAPGLYGLPAIKWHRLPARIVGASCPDGRTVSVCLPTHPGWKPVALLFPESVPYHSCSVIRDRCGKRWQADRQRYRDCTPDYWPNHNGWRPAVSPDPTRQ